MNLSRGRMKTILSQLPSGVAGTRATLRAMARLVAVFHVEHIIYQLARTIVRNVPGKDYLGELQAVQTWVRAHIRYTRDIHGIESLQWPTRTLEMGHGDCDDQAVLVASLLSAIGFPVRFRAVGWRAGAYVHVLTEGQLPGGRWVTVETTEPVAVGWEPGTRYSMYQEAA